MAELEVETGTLQALVDDADKGSRALAEAGDSWKAAADPWREMRAVESMFWDESGGSTIVSLSLGEMREFDLRRKTKCGVMAQSLNVN